MTEKGLNNQRGASLIELVFSLAIIPIVMIGVYGLFISGHRSYLLQESLADAQQRARTGMELMAREIRLIGFGVPEGVNDIISMGEGGITFRANMDNIRAILTSTIFQGQTTLKVSSGKDFKKNKVIYICDSEFCEEHTLSKDGASTTLELKEGLTRTYPAGSTINVVNEVAYSFKENTLYRKVDNGENPVAEEVVVLGFTYYDRGGKATQIPLEVMQVAITLTARTTRADPNWKENNGYRTKSLNTLITIRNR